MERFGLRDDQWDRIKDILPGRKGHVGGICIWNPGAVPSQFCCEIRLELGSLLFQNAPSHFDSHGKVAEPGDSTTWDDSNLWIA
jgi:hypothetical protein